MRTAICIDLSGSIPAKGIENILAFLHHAQKLIDGYVVGFTMDILFKCELHDFHDEYVTNADRGGTDFKCLWHHLRNGFGVIISDGQGLGLDTDNANIMFINPMAISDPKRLAICVSLLQEAILKLDD